MELKDDSLLSPDSNFSILLVIFWVLEETFQVSTGFGLVDCRPTSERDPTFDTTCEQHHHKND